MSLKIGSEDSYAWHGDDLSRQTSSGDRKCLVTKTGYSVFSARQHIIHMLSLYYAVARPFVRLFIPSHGWISQKRSKLGLCKCNFHGTVASFAG